MDGGDGINESDGGEYERVNMALMRVGWFGGGLINRESGREDRNRMEERGEYRRESSGCSVCSACSACSICLSISTVPVTVSCLSLPSLCLSLPPFAIPSIHGTRDELMPSQLTTHFSS